MHIEWCLRPTATGRRALTCGSMAAPLPQVGTMMAEFPLDPQLAKMMVTAPEYRYCSALQPS